MDGNTNPTEDRYGTGRFAHDPDGSVWASSNFEGSPEEYLGWDWKQIKAAIMGGSMVPAGVSPTRLLRVSDPSTLFNAAVTFLRAQLTLKMVAQSVRDQTEALTGENGPWQGPAAKSFNTMMNGFAAKLDARATMIGGGEYSADTVAEKSKDGNQPPPSTDNIPAQLWNNGNHLAWARQMVQQLDAYYANRAAADNAGTTSNGLVVISRRPDLVKQLNDAMMQVMNLLVQNYKVSTTDYIPPVADDSSLTNPDAVDPNLNPNLDNSGLGDLPPIDGPGVGDPNLDPNLANPNLDPNLANPNLDPNLANPNLDPNLANVDQPALDTPNLGGVPGADLPGASGLGGIPPLGLGSGLGLPTTGRSGLGTGSAGLAGLDGGTPGGAEAPAALESQVPGLGQTGLGTGLGSGMPPMAPMTPMSPSTPTNADRPDAAGLLDGESEPWSLDANAGLGDPTSDDTRAGTPQGWAAGGMPPMAPMMPMSPSTPVNAERPAAAGLLEGDSDPWTATETADLGDPGAGETHAAANPEEWAEASAATIEPPVEPALPVMAGPPATTPAQAGPQPVAAGSGPRPEDVAGTREIGRPADRGVAGNPSPAMVDSTTVTTGPDQLSADQRPAPDAPPNLVSGPAPGPAHTFDPATALMLPPLPARPRRKGRGSERRAEQDGPEALVPPAGSGPEPPDPPDPPRLDPAGEERITLVLPDDAADTAAWDKPDDLATLRDLFGPASAEEQPAPGHTIDPPEFAPSYQRLPPGLAEPERFLFDPDGELVLCGEDDSPEELDEEAEEMSEREVEEREPSAADYLFIDSAAWARRTEAPSGILE